MLLCSLDLGLRPCLDGLLLRLQLGIGLRCLLLDDGALTGSLLAQLSRDAIPLVDHRLLNLLLKSLRFAEDAGGLGVDISPGFGLQRGHRRALGQILVQIPQTGDRGQNIGVTLEPVEQRRSIDGQLWLIPRADNPQRHHQRAVLHVDGQAVVQPLAGQIDIAPSPDRQGFGIGKKVLVPEHAVLDGTGRREALQDGAELLTDEEIVGRRALQQRPGPQTFDQPGNVPTADG